MTETKAANGRKRGGRGALDEAVAQHALVPGIRTVRGWAVSEPPMSSAVLRVDGRPIATARVGLPRRTLAARNKAPVSEVCGFEAHLDLTAWSATGVELDAEITRLDGTTYLLDPVHLPAWESPPEIDAIPLWTPSRDVPPSSAPPSGRVLVFSHDLATYGSQRRMLDYLAALVASGSPLRFEVVAQSEGPLRDELEALGIPVHVSGPDGRQSASDYEEGVARTADLIARGGFDAVWANTLVSFAAVDAATRIGVPSFWFVHEGLEPTQFWAPEATAGLICPHAYERFLVALRSATTVACVARAARRTFQPYRDRTIAIVPNSIDLAPIRAYREAHDRAEVRARLGFGELDRLVLSCAPVVPHKGQSLLAQAFAALAPAHPRTTCVMIGDIGHPYGTAIAAYVGRLGLGEQIRLLPPVEDIYEWFLAADLFVLPSDEEALASVVLEAMAFDVPVVSTDVAGMPEAVDDGRTGILCRRRDVASLADALERALDLHPAAVPALRAQARAHVETAHDATVQARIVRNLLLALTEPAALDDPDAMPVPEIGPDVAFAVARDMGGAGTILQHGRGADVAFGLAELGLAVTMVEPDVAGGTLADWCRLNRSAAASALPQLAHETLNQHLAGQSPVYDAVLLFSGWPLSFGDGADALAAEVATISGRVPRAYVGVHSAGESAGSPEVLERALNARKAGSRVVHVASTLDLVGEPVDLYRVDLSGPATDQTA